MGKLTNEEKLRVSVTAVLGKLDPNRTYSLVLPSSQKPRPEAEGWRKEGELTYSGENFLIYSRPNAAPKKETPSAPERRPVRPGPQPEQPAARPVGRTGGWGRKAR